MHFPNLKDVLKDFHRDVVRVPYIEIQQTSLGQAKVRLRDAHARDALVQDSPHVFDNVLVTFVNHDRGRNWRYAEFNYECWLLLLDFPNDYLYEWQVQQVVADFARILSFNLVQGADATLLIKARVKDLDQVPQFVVFEDPDT